MNYKRPDHYDELYDPNLVVLPCHHCFRTFKPEIIERHQSVCYRHKLREKNRLRSLKPKITNDGININSDLKQLSDLMYNKNFRRRKWRIDHERFLKELVNLKEFNNSSNLNLSSTINRVENFNDLISTNSLDFVQRTMHKSWLNKSRSDSESSDSLNSIDSISSVLEKNNHHIQKHSRSKINKPGEIYKYLDKNNNKTKKYFSRTKSVPNIVSKNQNDSSISDNYDCKTQNVNERNKMLSCEKLTARPEWKPTDESYHKPPNPDLYNPKLNALNVIEAIKNYKAENNIETETYLKKIHKVVNYYQKNFWENSDKPSVIEDIPNNLSIHRTRLERFKQKNRKLLQPTKTDEEKAEPIKPWKNNDNKNVSDKSEYCDKSIKYKNTDVTPDKNKNLNDQSRNYNTSDQQEIKAYDKHDKLHNSCDNHKVCHDYDKQKPPLPTNDQSNQCKPSEHNEIKVTDKYARFRNSDNCNTCQDYDKQKSPMPTNDQSHIICKASDQPDRKSCEKPMISTKSVRFQNCDNCNCNTDHGSMNDISRNNNINENQNQCKRSILKDSSCNTDDHDQMDFIQSPKKVEPMDGTPKTYFTTSAQPPVTDNARNRSNCSNQVGQCFQECQLERLKSQSKVLVPCPNASKIPATSAEIKDTPSLITKPLVRKPYNECAKNSTKKEEAKCKFAGGTDDAEYMRAWKVALN